MVRILVPVLDSVNAVPAVRHVIGEFLRGERMDVHLLHVRAPLSLHVAQWLSASNRAAYHRDAAEQVLRPAQDLLARFHIRSTRHIEIGSDKAAAIVAKARGLGVNRIVLGAARDNTLTRFVEDAVIQRVTQQASVPVEVVGGRSVSRLERFGVPLGLGAALGLLWLRLND